LFAGIVAVVIVGRRSGRRWRERPFDFAREEDSLCWDPFVETLRMTSRSSEHRRAEERRKEAETGLTLLNST
jgi:hypothetical protein